MIHLKLMEASEIINTIKKYLVENIPLESYKYLDLIQGSVTEREYFKNDKELSKCNINEIKIII